VSIPLIKPKQYLEESDDSELSVANDSIEKKSESIPLSDNENDEESVDLFEKYDAIFSY
jgi:hypothetical protein